MRDKIKEVRKEYKDRIDIIRQQIVKMQSEFEASLVTETTVAKGQQEGEVKPKEEQEQQLGDGDKELPYEEVADQQQPDRNREEEVEG